ncbi:hypothetical protein LINGRAHAP2_LOCUS24415 [Linum grandiflorum]
MSYMKEGERNMPQTAAHLTDKKKKNNRGDRRWRQAGKERISVKITEKKLESLSPTRCSMDLSTKIDWDMIYEPTCSGKVFETDYPKTSL